MKCKGKVAGAAQIFWVKYSITTFGTPHVVLSRNTAEKSALLRIKKIKKKLVRDEANRTVRIAQRSDGVVTCLVTSAPFLRGQ